MSGYKRDAVIIKKRSNEEKCKLARVAIREVLIIKERRFYIKQGGCMRDGYKRRTDKIKEDKRREDDGWMNLRGFFEHCRSEVE